MALTRSLTVYNGSDSSPATDFTDRTDWQQTELAGMANLGDAAAGQWVLRDEGGTFPDYVAPGEFLDAHNVLIARVGSNTLFRGRIAAQEHFRGRQKAGRASEWSVTLEDQNSHLRGIVVHNWVRPAETDAARAQGLVASYLSGSPRVTTNLNGSNLVITGSNTISLPAKTYSGVTPFEIMQELAANADKEMFVSVDNELAYFGHDYTGYASLLRISDDPADTNSTTYAPWDPRGNEYGRQKLSALRVYYGTDVTASTKQVTNSNAPQFDYWEDVFWDSESTTDAQAIARAQKQLDYRSTDDISYSCAIGPMSGDEIWKIKPGQQIQFKSRAARGGRAANGSYLGDTFLTTRVRELRWTTPAEDEYIAHLELERPKRIGAPSKGSQALTIMPTVQPSCIDTFTRTVTRGWGTSEIYGYEWTDAGFTSPSGLSVDGAKGIITVDLPDQYPQPHLILSDATDPLELRFSATQSNWVNGTQFFLDSGVDTTSILFEEVGSDHWAAVDTPNGGGNIVDLGLSNAFEVRWRLSAGSIKIKVWVHGQPEPAGWSYEETDVDIPFATDFYIASGNWDGLVVTFDNFQVVEGLCADTSPWPAIASGSSFVAAAKWGTE